MTEHEPVFDIEQAERLSGVMHLLQRAYTEEIYANPPGAQLPGSAAVKALLEHPEHLLTMLAEAGLVEEVPHYDHAVGWQQGLEYSVNVTRDCRCHVRRCALHSRPGDMASAPRIFVLKQPA